MGHWGVFCDDLWRWDRGERNMGSMADRGHGRKIRDADEGEEDSWSEPFCEDFFEQLVTQLMVPVAPPLFEAINSCVED